MPQYSFDQLPQAIFELHERVANIERLLLSLPHNLPSEQDNVLTIKEAAAFLSLSVATVYTLVSKAQIPVVKRSKRLYFFKSDLIEWLREARRDTTETIEKKALENFSLHNKIK